MCGFAQNYLYFYSGFLVLYNNFSINMCVYVFNVWPPIHISMVLMYVYVCVVIIYCYPSYMKYIAAFSVRNFNEIHNSFSVMTSVPESNSTSLCSGRKKNSCQRCWRVNEYMRLYYRGSQPVAQCCVTGCSRFKFSLRQG